MQPALTDAQLARATMYALKSGSELKDARTLAKAGRLTVDGRLKMPGGPAPEKGERRATVEPTTEEIAAFHRRAREARYLLLGKDEYGFFIIGGGRRSKSYPTVGQIPVVVIRDFAG